VSSCAARHILTHNRNHHILAMIAYKENDLQTAFDLEEKALKIFLKAYPIHPLVATAYYRQGCVRLRQDRLDEALTRFQMALDITQLYESEKGDKGESARVLWRMSQALELQGRQAEASELKRAAKEIHETLYATGLYTAPSNEEEGWDNLQSFWYR
jgi:tetratricopeptide (TPR) repeat protein